MHHLKSSLVSIPQWETGPQPFLLIRPGSALLAMACGITVPALTGLSCIPWANGIGLGHPIAQQRAWHVLDK